MELEEKLILVIVKAREEGCPISFESSNIAEYAIRRWMSAPRRIKKMNIENRIDDLTKGLISKFEKSPGLVGPLKRDYIWLAKRLAEVLVAEVKAKH